MDIVHRTHNHATADVAQAWRDAALYLERHGWTQRIAYRRADGDNANPTPPACAIGALGMAVYGRTLDDLHTPDHPEAAFFNWVEGLFEDYLDLAGYLTTEPPHRGLGIGEWNDHPARTATEVIELLRTAADEWDTYYRCGGAA